MRENRTSNLRHYGASNVHVIVCGGRVHMEMELRCPIGYGE
jgi:hypothetical protein